MVISFKKVVKQNLGLIVQPKEAILETLVEALQELGSDAEVRCVIGRARKYRCHRKG